MRYEAYSREGNIEQNSSGLFRDAEDECENVWLLAIYIDGELASSIRLHIGSRPQHYLPVTVAFPDIVAPRLDAGEILIDATRQTSSLEFTRAYPFLTYVTMRAIFVAEEHFGADYIVAAARPEYVQAFRRMCGSSIWAEARPYPRLKKLQALTAYDCKANRNAIRVRYPFIRSTMQERIALFGRTSTSERDLYADLTSGRRLRPSGETQHAMTCVA
jgi:hypothetical protein